MTDRRGVLMLLFDLPMKTAADRRAYAHFRKLLRKEGFVIFQESCYIRLLRNISSAQGELERIRRELPPEGLVHILPMSLGQFRSMQCLLGTPYDFGTFSDDVVYLGSFRDEEEEKAG